MARTIDADKLLDDITAAEEHGGMGAVIAGTLRRYVMRQLTLTPPNEWVSVEERLPEEKQRVIVRCEHVGTSVGWILWGRWMTDIGPHAGDVTHWMPLPVPPDEPAHDMNVVLQRALDTWGAEAQTRMMFEEMAELQKELCKWLRGLGDREHIAEEIADVEIMLDQMKLLHNCADEVKSWRLRKLGRLSARLST